MSLNTRTRSTDQSRQSSKFLRILGTVTNIPVEGSRTLALLVGRPKHGLRPKLGPGPVGCKCTSRISTCGNMPCNTRTRSTDGSRQTNLDNQCSVTVTNIPAAGSKTVNLARLAHRSKDRHRLLLGPGPADCKSHSGIHAFSY